MKALQDEKEAAKKVTTHTRDMSKRERERERERVRPYRLDPPSSRKKPKKQPN